MKNKLSLFSNNFKNKILFFEKYSYKEYFFERITEEKDNKNIKKDKNNNSNNKKNQAINKEYFNKIIYYLCFFIPF